MKRLVLGLVGIFALGWAGTAQAQCAPGTANFDACFNSQLQGLQQQNAMGQQQLWDNYLQAYGPLLDREYRSWGYQTGATFEQFAYYMLMSANGTNIEGALQAQRDWFAGVGKAHDTVVQGNDDYLRGIQGGSEGALGAVEQNDIGAVRGNIVVNGPDGEVELPYSGVSVGQSVQANGYTYMMTPQGYAVQTPYGWSLLQ